MPKWCSKWCSKRHKIGVVNNFQFITEKYLEKNTKVNKSSTIEMWRLREQAKMATEENIMLDIVNSYR